VKRKLLLSIAIGVIFLSSCSLNGRQEASLNSAKIAYLEAHNTHKVALRIKLTYPEVIRYYRSLGDSTFKERFRPENNQKYLQNGAITAIESKGSQIHVQFEFEGITENESAIVMDPVILFAISSDEGEHWKFLESQDYFNDRILSTSERLINKE
jgi:hypothetical protein